jgi:Predicted Zn-dependent proteases and their inactivated homologs
VADTAGSPNGRIDPEFTAYPLRALADNALQRATELGAQHADFRAERILAQRIVLSDGTPETLDDSDVLGLAVRVVVDGTWGFAATVDMTPDAAGLRPPKRCRSRGLRGY